MQPQLIFCPVTIWNIRQKIISLSCGAGCGFSLFCFSIRNLVFVADIFIALMAGNNMKRMQTEWKALTETFRPIAGTF